MYVTRSLSFHIIIIFVLGAVHKGHHHLKKFIKFLWNFFQILSQKRFFSNFIGKGCNLGNSDVLIRGNFWIEDIRGHRGGRGQKNREKVVTSYMDGPVRRSNHIETYVHHLSAIEGAKWKLIFIAFFSHCGTYSSLVEGFFDPPSEIMEWK